MVKPLSSAALAVRRALQREKVSFDTKQRAKFVANKQDLTDPREASHLRTLLTKTFFTPHLDPKKRSPLTKDRLSREYAVILEIQGQPTVSITPYNPARETTLLNKAFRPSIALQNKIHLLESAGYRFHGTNKDILVFERLYNPQQHARKWVMRSVTVVTASVTAVTAALFAGEYVANFFVS